MLENIVLLVLYAIKMKAMLSLAALILVVARISCCFFITKYKQRDKKKYSFT